MSIFNKSDFAKIRNVATQNYFIRRNAPVVQPQRSTDDFGFKFRMSAFKEDFAKTGHREQGDVLAKSFFSLQILDIFSRDRL